MRAGNTAASQSPPPCSPRKQGVACDCASAPLLYLPPLSYAPHRPPHATVPHRPQQEFADDDDDGDGDEDEEGRGGAAAQEELLIAVADLLPAMAAAAGPGLYAPVFGSLHLPAMLERLKPQQPDDVRSVVVGALAEVAEVLQVGVWGGAGQVQGRRVARSTGGGTSERQNRAADSTEHQGVGWAGCVRCVEGRGA